jgi:hypothetical protein
MIGGMLQDGAFVNYDPSRCRPWDMMISMTVMGLLDEELE